MQVIKPEGYDVQFCTEDYDAVRLGSIVIDKIIEEMGKLKCEEMQAEDGTTFALNWLEDLQSMMNKLVNVVGNYEAKFY